MSRNLSSLFQEESHKSEQGELLRLVVLVLPNNTLLHIVDSNDVITYEGQEYVPFPLKYTPPEMNTDGTVSKTSIMVANPERTLMPYIEQYSGLRGCRLEVFTVYRAHLAVPNSVIHDEFIIDSFVATDQSVVFQLDPVINMETKLPRRKFMTDSCGWRFKEASTCKYTYNCPGTITNNTKSLYVNTEQVRYFTVGSQVTLVRGATTLTTSIAALDKIAGTVTLLDTWVGVTASDVVVSYANCPKTLLGCRMRQNQSRYGGFPGVPSMNRRFVL